MNELIQATAVLAAFAAAHERLIEFIRSVNDRLAAASAWWKRYPATWIQRHTIGAGNMVIAIVLAFATQANLLALFCTTPNSQQAMFFDLFMTLHPFRTASVASGGLSLRALATGYVLMGLTTALGSQFWHDLANGLIDLRQSIQAVSASTSSQGVPTKASTPVVLGATAANAPPVAAAVISTASVPAMVLAGK